MTANELLRKLASEIPDGYEITVYIGRGDIGIQMCGREPEPGDERDHPLTIGEFANGVLPDAESALLDALTICLEDDK